MKKANGRKIKMRRKANDLIAKTAVNIKNYRVKAKLTQEQLENNTGISVSRCESGTHDMTLTTINILSKELNIQPYELLM